MKKKVIIISSITLVFVLAVALIVLLVFNKDKDLNTEKEKFDNEIVSILTIDVNPSIEINLNKNNIVVSVVALNDDAKVVTNNLNYEKEKLENVLSMLVDSLKQNNYLSDENNLILINVDSKDEKLLELVKNKTNESLEKNKVNGEIVIQQVEETSELKELAEKNNITISKAYYIQEQIKNEEGLKVEDFKDTSITEIKEKINNYKQEQEQKKQEELKEKTTTKQTNTNTSKNTTPNTNTTTQKVTKTYTCTPPNDLKDTEWCNWNNKRPQSCEFYYDDISTDKVRGYALSRYNLDDSASTYITTQEYKGASYCRAHIVKINTSSEKIISYWDSHTGEFLKEKRETAPTYISTETAQTVAKNYIKNNKNNAFDEAEIKYSEVNSGTDRDGGPDEYYRHQVLFIMNDGTHYTVDVDAVTKEVKYYRTWTN